MLTALLWGMTCAALGAEDVSYPAGTLLVLENCNSVVESWTHSRVGHVALVFPEQEKLWVFEATPGQVRRLSLADYQAELAELNRRRKGDIRAKVYRPRETYTQEEAQRMRRYLDAQIGRRYSVANYAKDRVGDGIHCAELASHTLNHSGRFEIAECHRETPETITAKIASKYEDATDLPLPQPPAEGDWCSRSWKQWSDWGHWCQWSCGEAWAWCW